MDEAETLWKVGPRGVSLIGRTRIGKQGSDEKALEGMRMLDLPPIQVTPCIQFAFSL